jgi:hypothetical protein
MLSLVIYTVGFCTNALQTSSKSIYYSLFISPNFSAYSKFINYPYNSVWYWLVIFHVSTHLVCFIKLRNCENCYNTWNVKIITSVFELEKWNGPGTMCSPWATWETMLTVDWSWKTYNKYWVQVSAHDTHHWANIGGGGKPYFLI